MNARAGCLLLLLLVLGCEEEQPPPEGQPPPVAAAALCSPMHRDLSRWQGTEIADCGPDVSGLVELTPLGNDWLLARKRFSHFDDLWSLSADGVTDPGAGPTPVDPVMGAATAGFATLSSSPPRVLVYDPRQSRWNLFTTRRSIANRSVFSSAGEGQWPVGYWPANANGGPWGHQFIGLGGDHLLDRDLGDGSTRIWSVVTGDVGGALAQLVPSTRLVGGPEERFRRGHRLVPLGPNRLLEWLPRACPHRPSPSDPCAGSDFNVWSYSLDDGAAAFAPQIVSSGFWPDIGDESDLLADGAHLFVWTRATGRLRSHAIDPALADPLRQPLEDPPPDSRLASHDWSPPTTAPAIKHLVVVLQNGRSFDAYFGHTCQGPAGTGTPLPCTEGPACCEAMPLAVAGADACTDPETYPSYRPVDLPECLRAKMDDGKMDGFAVSHPPDVCGDPRDFSCASADGAATYQNLAATGALADRFFQTYAFVDGAAAAAEPDAITTNLLYLVSARFTAFPPSLIDTPLLTKELARLQVAWAIYAGPVALPQLRVFGVPIFYDPDWFPFRSLNGGELEHDLAAGTLPPVAVVLPDRADPFRSEDPGRPFGPGMAYVESLVDAIATSPYHDDTLVLVTHLTAGGFYDHVPPPPPPSLTVDGSSRTAAQGTAVAYGPRVPLLAVGRFARASTISHAQLEISSITRFVEWNWLHGAALKDSREDDDVRRYRDMVVNNLGSLIDGAAAGIEVPRGTE